jgi:hypothetical protein
VAQVVEHWLRNLRALSWLHYEREREKRKITKKLDLFPKCVLQLVWTKMTLYLQCPSII